MLSAGEQNPFGHGRNGPAGAASLVSCSDQTPLQIGMRPLIKSFVAAAEKVPLIVDADRSVTVSGMVLPVSPHAVQPSQYADREVAFNDGTVAVPPAHSVNPEPTFPPPEKSTRSSPEWLTTRAPPPDQELLAQKTPRQLVKG